MADPFKMTNKQSRPIKVVVLDQDGQPLAALPAGASLTFTPTDPAILGVADGADAFSRVVTSGQDGDASVVVHADGLLRADGTPMPDVAIAFEVTNSQPDSLNVQVGDPVDETPAPAPTP